MNTSRQRVRILREMASDQARRRGVDHPGTAYICFPRAMAGRDGADRSTTNTPMLELFDLPVDFRRYLIPTRELRERIILGACQPRYQNFLRSYHGRTIVADGSGHTTIVIAGAVKIGSGPPCSVQEFLAKVARGARPWEREPIGGLRVLPGGKVEAEAPVRPFEEETDRGQFYQGPRRGPGRGRRRLERARGK